MLCGVLMSACSNPRGAAEHDDFSQKMESLVELQRRNQIPSEILASELFRRDEFRFVYVASSSNFESIESYISSEAPIQYRVMAVRVSQCLSAADYLRLIYAAHRNEGASLIVATLLDPGIEWGKVPYEVAGTEGADSTYAAIVGEVAAIPELGRHASGLLDGSKSELQRIEQLKFPECL